MFRFSIANIVICQEFTESNIDSVSFVAGKIDFPGSNCDARVEFRVFYCELKEFTAVVLGVVKILGAKTYCFNSRDYLTNDFEAVLDLRPVLAVCCLLIWAVYWIFLEFSNIRIEAQSVQNHSTLLAILS